ncbi:MAG: ABC transporter permease [Planctomycetes bacterium]|nr:ABC transporter permease [Planctomycetota bacterium]
MTTYIIKRLLLMIPTLFGITIVVFVISHLAPGDPIEAEFGGGGGMGAGATAGATQTMAERQAMIEARKKELGLDQPIPIQYAMWLGRVVQGDWGESLKYRVPVSEKIWDALGVTVQLNMISLALIYLIAVPLGIHAAVRRGKKDERVVGISLFALYSAPSFWVATILLFYFASPAHFEWFDGVGLHSERYEQLTYWGQLKDWAWHLVLPVICLTYNGLAGLSRYARSGMLEIIRRDYIRTARAKGLPERTVIFKHALRNSLIPIVTLMASLLPAMIGGSVIIEYIFTINGMGKLSIDAILSRDYNMVMAFTTLSAVLVLLGMLLSDILYTVVDPRISLEG